MIELDEYQAGLLTEAFEECFDNKYTYFEFLGIDEVYMFLIGGEVRMDFYDLLERTVYFDNNNLGFAVFLHEFLIDIDKRIKETYENEGVELWELANNCKILKDKLHEIIHTDEPLT